MIRSLFSGVSGLKNHQIRMDVVGNNISNVNTSGYKAGSTNFQDALSQTIRSGGNGRNPSQIGTGMSVGSIYNDFTQGPTQNTGRSLDLAINGNGFFVVRDAETDAEYYTRAGALFLDNEGYLINSDGLRIQSSTGDIRVFNGPVSTISVGSDGTITGTNTNDEPLQFTSTPITIPAPTPVTEAQLTGGNINEKIQPMVSATGSLTGDTINPATAPVEAIVKGNSTGAADIGGTNPPINMAGYELDITYDDGINPPIAVNDITNNAAFNSIQTWEQLVTALQNAINSSAIGADKIKVSYDDGYNSGLVFETITDPDAPAAITPSITIGGTDVSEYMGSVTGGNLTDTGEPVITQDWSGKTFYFDVGEGWQGITTDATLDEITSGDDLAAKLQALIDAAAGGIGDATLSVSWDTDHLVFTPTNGSTSVKLKGEGIADFIGTGSAATESNIDWTSKDITISYNGTTYSFSSSEKQAAGLGSITNGNALAAALNTLIDDKIGSDKVDFTWSVDHLVINTKDTTGIGNKPSIVIGGTNAADFVGATTSAYGIASTQPEIPGQEPDNVIRLVTFSNPEGLIKVGTNIYESNAATSGLPVNDTVSTIDASYLEMSNVDLTDEFSNMIVTQRGYQANSRIITVSDTMLEELMNLKR